MNRFRAGWHLRRWKTKKYCEVRAPLIVGKMREETPPARIAVVWSPEVRADIRAIERKAAMQILRCVDDYISKRVDGVKKMRPCLTEITGVRNRKEAYR